MRWLLGRLLRLDRCWPRCSVGMEVLAIDSKSLIDNFGRVSCFEPGAVFRNRKDNPSDTMSKAKVGFAIRTNPRGFVIKALRQSAVGGCGLRRGRRIVRYLMGSNRGQQKV